MGFAGGSLSFKRFFVDGARPQRVDERLLQRLVARAIDADGVRTADGTEIGWITGEHILDTAFDLARNALADGLHFAMRIDTHKPPGELVRSYQRINEQAMLEASGREFLSKPERREAREQALARADAEARSGQFRRMRQVPVFWDVARGEVYLGAAGPGVVDQFTLLFRETFERGVVAATAGEMAARWAALAGDARAFDECRPAHLVSPPDGADAAEAWVHDRSRDFLGSEFLSWLWYTAQVESPEVTTQPGQSVTVLFERSLQLECAFKVSGALAIQADSPTRLPEATVALAGGKRPVRAGLQLACRGDVFALTLRGDAMHYSGVKLPPPEQSAAPRAVFDDRLARLRELIDAVGELYSAFLKKRLSSKWAQTLAAMRAWAAAGQIPAGEVRAAS